ncbi:NADPH-dependent 7-cyano-7-deazaguanine reductase QueF [Candidatus Tisiphia endosymbiont of Nemotelus uliginosus]|uniref:NADPH-dependent 7-cyano-7-deazaguanine reductase QueF n=1 Tax=Candidatus Tisiphia endosymbiont of Nemotelus uliginosus TaxID=3077926 RepID=UPI0035C8D103
MNLTDSLLGKKTEYVTTYDPTLLFPIARASQRQELTCNQDNLPFFGVDIWNAYEISWLNLQGKPQVMIGEFYIPANSQYIIESKSLKLYLNSFNNSKFESIDKIKHLLLQDLSHLVQAKINITLLPLNIPYRFEVLPGKNIDHLEIQCENYPAADKSLIKYYNTHIVEEIYSDLLRTNCPITNQPDWGSISIKYSGKKIDHASLLKYIISFRNHNEFHEQCVERIFMDIYSITRPEYLAIYARYTRRGGIDISPYRSSDHNFLIPSNKRLIRQ